MRTTKRIPLKVKFTVIGQRPTGGTFETEAESVVLSPIGGCLSFDQDVKEGDYLLLVASNGRSFTANVRWFKHDNGCSLRYVGFKLMEPKTGWVVADGSQLRARASGT